jgi:hypothetical protein
MIAPTLPGSHSSRRVPFFLQTPRQALHGPGWPTGSVRFTSHGPGRGEAAAAPVTTPSGREHKQRSAPRHFVASSARPCLPLLLVPLLVVQARGGVKMRLAGTDGVIVPQLVLIVVDHEEPAQTAATPAWSRPSCWATPGAHAARHARRAVDAAGATSAAARDRHVRAELSLWLMPNAL